MAITEAQDATEVSSPDLSATREEIRRYERSPVDVIRLLVFTAITLGLGALAKWSEHSVLGFERDVVVLFDFLNAPVARVVSGAMQVFVGVLIVAYFVVPIVTRRYRLFGYLIVANIAAGGLASLFVWSVDRTKPAVLVNAIARRAGLSAHFPTEWAMAVLVAAFIVLAPFVGRRWRRAGWVSICVILLCRLIVSVHLPVDLLACMSLGAAVGTAVLLAFGRPDRHPTTAAVESALRNGGTPITELAPAAVDARGSAPYFGRLEDGTRIFAKVLGADERSADLLFRAYRFIWLKNVGDERPFSSLRRTVEHEALVSLRARDVGVRTPRLRAISDVGDDSMLLSFDLIEGRSLDQVDAAAVTDDVLTLVWQQLELLRRYRIAHRDLRRANIFLAPDGRPWIIDFGFSELAASQELLDADVAELVASLAIEVGATRSVDSAIRVIGTEAVGAALPLLQPNALSGATRTALKEHAGLLGELQTTVADRCSIAQPHYEQLERVSGKRIFTVVMLAAVTYFLLPQLVDLPGIFREIAHATWLWLPPAIVLSAVTYVGAAMSMLGAVPDRIRSIPTFVAQVGSSFTNKIAPAGMGGMALNLRYLQKAGVDSAVAASSVGLNSVGGLVVHVTLLVIFALWSGRSAFDSFHLPDWHIFAYGVAAVVVLAVVAFSIRSVRTLLLSRVMPLLRRSAGGVHQIVRRPGKLTLLLGGSAVVTLSYVVCLYLCMRGFGGHLPFATLGAVYLTGAAIATAAPTPGGLGALEAAVIAGLVAAGVDKEVAVPAVFLFRLVTFWLPILPGYVCFRWLRREDFV